jgi:poly(3-hydroxybutyrate) depolymerase
MGHSGSGGLERRTLDIAGVRRTYWLARGPGTDGQSGWLPLLIVLHGSGTSGRDVATTFTGWPPEGRLPG